MSSHTSVLGVAAGPEVQTQSVGLRPAVYVSVDLSERVSGLSGRGL